MKCKKLLKLLVGMILVGVPCAFAQLAPEPQESLESLFVANPARDGRLFAPGNAPGAAVVLPAVFQRSSVAVDTGEASDRGEGFNAPAAPAKAPTVQFSLLGVSEKLLPLDPADRLAQASFSGDVAAEWANREFLTAQPARVFVSPPSSGFVTSHF